MNQQQMNKEPIDFVILWVDGKDPEWIAEKIKYSAADGMDASESRYRDWDNLQFLFRGIEQFTPWVRTVHFVTWGHLPKWLNVNHPKLHIVNHKDYIPAEYLPTFNANTIELNLHRIEGLSEHFVFLNDDLFFLKQIEPNLFFKNNLPRHPVWLRHIVPEPNNPVMPHIYINDVSLINRHFKACESYKRDRDKWFSLDGDQESWEMNKHFLQYDKFSGFRNEHLACPILKSTITKMWNLERATLDRTCRNRFRSIFDVNQYIFRYWQIASGQFEPIKRNELGQYHVITHDIRQICTDIIEQKYAIICLNDMGDIQNNEEFIRVKNEISQSFKKVLGVKSKYEL